MAMAIRAILEFRAESFQWLAAPPRRREFDGTMKPLAASGLAIGKPIKRCDGQGGHGVRKAHNTPSNGS